MAQRALAASDIFFRAAGLIVVFLGAALAAGAATGLLPLFFATHFAFINADNLALAAADIGLRAGVALVLAAGGDCLPALTFAQRAFAAARSLFLVTSDMPPLAGAV